MTQENTALIKISPETDEAVVALVNEVSSILGYAQQRIITTADDVKVATNDLSLISKLKKAVEEKRKEYLEPLNDYVKVINNAFKLLSEPLTEADRITKQKILSYNAEIERQRQEQEEINRLRMEAAQKEMELKGELTESVDLVEVISEAPKRVSTDMGTAGQRDNWKYEVVLFSIVPDEYKMINAGVLTPVVKASKGKITIPGIRIFNEPIIAVNAR